jgi:hypothetical protein
MSSSSVLLLPIDRLVVVQRNSSGNRSKEYSTGAVQGAAH